MTHMYLFSYRTMHREGEWWRVSNGIALFGLSNIPCNIIVPADRPWHVLIYCIVLVAWIINYCLTLRHMLIRTNLMPENYLRHDPFYEDIFSHVSVCPKKSGLKIAYTSVENVNACHLLRWSKHKSIIKLLDSSKLTIFLHVISIASHRIIKN